MSKRKCKHRAVWFDHLARDVGDGINMEYRRCCACGEWLSLGKSNDTGIEHEIRAAEIAAGLLDAGCEVSSLERSGFNDTPMTLRNGAPVFMDTESQRAGWLAHSIVTHSEEP